MWQELQPGDPQLIGPYRLRGQLGVGGMGRVFFGLSADGRPVAVKVVRADLAADPEFRARFRREVAVARRVSGQFTAPVVDADLDGPMPWLATAYVAGPSLADAVTEHGPLPTGSVLELAAGLAEGLSAVHAAGVVHRDLKPSNVLLAQDGPRLIDFGISRAVEASALTHTGMVVGSPGFMSPEQAEGREVGPPSDIFSLGAILAFAATGEGPFGAGSTPALVYRVVYSPPSLDRVPAQVRPLIERCLDKDPGRRPTARDLLAWTGTVQPVTGWLPDPVTRTFLQHPALAGATVVDAASSQALAAGSHNQTDPGASRTVTVAKLASAWAPAAGQPRRREGRPRRGHLGRWLAIASMAAGLLGASAAGGFALTASAHQSSGLHSGRAAPVRTTSPATSAPSAPVYPSTYAPPAAVPSTSSPVAPPTMSPSAAPSAPTYSPAPTSSPTPTSSLAPTSSPVAAPPSAAPAPSATSTPSADPSASAPTASEPPAAASGSY